MVHTRQTSLRYYRTIRGSDDAFWAIEVEEIPRTWVHIGNIGVTVDSKNGTGDLAILIGEKRFWGQGLGARAWSEALHRCFDTLSLRLVTAGTMEINKPMVRLFEVSGMQQRGRVPGRFLWHGKPVDLVLVSKFAAADR